MTATLTRTMAAVKLDETWSSLVGSSRHVAGKLTRPSAPFDVLLSTQVLMLVGDAMVAISLAGSLFFNISPHAARGHVLLGLGLTFVPFVVIAPAIGPLLDSVRGMRRGMVLVSAAGRVALCIAMARDLKSLLLFPESFGLLVLSKVYGVSRQSLVPDVIGHDQSAGDERFVRANSALNFYGAVAGFAGSAVAVSIWKIPGLGSPWVLRVDAVVFALATAYAFRLPRGRAEGMDTQERGRAEGMDTQERGRAEGMDTRERGRAATQGESRAAASGREGDTDPLGVPALPASSPYLGRSPEQRDLGTRPERRAGADEPALSVRHRGLRNTIARQRMAGLFAAASAMAVLRGAVGFLEFLLIFTLRRQHYSLIWFGVVLTGLTAGSVLANMLAPRVRERLAEEGIVLAALGAVCAVSALVAWTGGMVAEAVLMAATGFSTGVAKVAFDAMVQRDTPEERRGTAFARFETRFQLVWVAGAVIPVAITFPLAWGNFAMAIGAAVAAAAYGSRWHALRRRARR